MSIVTLKRKTNAQYNKTSSHALPAFSLNGGHRDMLGYVGRDMISGRYLSRTLMRSGSANDAVGYGGCCGQYEDNPSKRILYGSGVISWNDPNIIKPSVVSTNGMLSKRYQCCKSHWTVKSFPDGNDLLEQKKQNAMCGVSISKQLQTNTVCPGVICEAHPSFFKTNYIRGNLSHTGSTNAKDAKKDTQHMPILQSEYLWGKKMSCAKNVTFPEQSIKHMPVLGR